MDIKTAERLVQLRKQHGLSQEELAAKLGLSRQAVSKWERAEASPDTDNLILLSRLYGVSIDELLGVASSAPADGEAANADGGMKREATYGDDEDNIKVNIDADLSGSEDAPDEDTSGEDAPPTFMKALLRNFPYAVFVTFLYLLLGFVWDLWHPAWLLFVTIPLYSAFARWYCGNRSWRSAFPYALFVSIIYLAMGFIWDLWHPGWIVFLTIPIYASIVDWRRGDRKGSLWRRFPYAVAITVVYLLLGFVWDLWHPGWVIYLTIPIYSAIARSVDASRKMEENHE